MGMRSQITTLVLGALGALGGGWLVGIWCFGVVLIALSGGVIVWALFHDDGKNAAGQPQVYAFGAPTLDQVLERARGAP
jgi:hypothetical protein